MSAPLLLPLALLLLPIACAGAVQSEAVTVQRIIDGDSLVVDATVGGLAAGLTVRLRWVDTPEHDEIGAAAANRLVATLAPVGSQVRLLLPGESAELDGHGRLLALVLDDEGRLLQEELVAAGHSAYWRRFGQAPDPWHERLLRAQAQARRDGRGRWRSDPDRMASDAAERR